MSAFWWILENPLLALLMFGCLTCIAAMIATRLTADANPDDTDYDDWRGL